MKVIKENGITIYQLENGSKLVVWEIEPEEVEQLTEICQVIYPMAEPYKVGQSHRLSLQLGKNYSFGSKTYFDRTDTELGKIAYEELLEFSKDTGFEYNGIHINYYDYSKLIGVNHNSMLGWHTDIEDSLDTSVPVLSFSLGSETMFQIKEGSKTHTIMLNNGHACMFNGSIEHRVVRPSNEGQRISITFRKHK